MRVIVYRSSYKSLVEAMAVGARKHGHRVEWKTVFEYGGSCEGDVVVVVGGSGREKRILRDALMGGAKVVCISDGFIGRQKDWRESGLGEHAVTSRDPYWSVARDGVHAYGQHVDPGCVDLSRWEKLGIELRPWKDGGDGVLFALQPPRRSRPIGGDCIDRNVWYERAIKWVLNETDERVYLRGHPHGGRDRDGQFRGLRGVWGSRLVITRESLGVLCRERVSLVLTYDSNASVDAVILGCPVMVGGRTMADLVVGRFRFDGLEYVRRDRDEWCKFISWAQWRESEMRSGQVWDVYIERFEALGGVGGGVSVVDVYGDGGGEEWEAVGDDGRSGLDGHVVWGGDILHERLVTRWPRKVEVKRMERRRGSELTVAERKKVDHGQVERSDGV